MCLSVYVYIQPNDEQHEHLKLQQLNVFTNFIHDILNVFNILLSVSDTLLNVPNNLPNVCPNFHVLLDNVSNVFVYNILLIIYIPFDVLHLVLRHTNRHRHPHYLPASHRDRYRDHRAWREPEEEEEDLRLSDLNPANLCECRNTREGEKEQKKAYNELQAEWIIGTITSEKDQD
ncbi:MAG: hypothetical protein Q9201_002289 [Fulgogasparrea decipioides]